MIIDDFLNHKDDPVPHTLVVTGPDPVPVEMPGPAVGEYTGTVINRHDLRTTQEEADTIILQQVMQYTCSIVQSDTNISIFLVISI